MPTFLFWNINNNERIGQTVAALAKRFDVDVLLLAEAPANIRPAGLLPALNTDDFTRYQHLSSGVCAKIEGYISSRYQTIPVSATADYVLFRLENDRERLLIAATHLPSKLYEDSYEQRRNAEKLAEGITAAEDNENVGHQNTLVVGDFNMNPFETGMIAANGLHAVMTRQLARGKRDTPHARVVDGHEYRLFYNPFWAQMGERDNASIGSYYGTYYYDKGRSVTYFWNWFDQVLLRPSLLPRFKDEDLHILTSLTETPSRRDGENELLTEAGLPNMQEYSDHLPILFRITDLP